ncbi:MAG TPA: hypothetical protein VFO60_10005 [Candidatus Dormibacteraeota bacterium]|nr:hypothetical protein [Candidatus Dormibacteraeota bacterium]
MGRERRDGRARALRDALASRLECHPRRLGALSAEIVSAMLERLHDDPPLDFRTRDHNGETSTVVTPSWDSRAG